MKKFLFPAFVCLAIFLAGYEKNSTGYQKSDLLGAWNMVKVGDELAPKDQIIQITFKSNDTFGGHTATNNYGGNFNFTDSILLISEVFSTNAVELPYGKIFFHLFSISMMHRILQSC